MSEQIGFIGLGNIGFYIAANLSRSLSTTGHPPLKVYTRSEPKRTSFVSEHSHSVAVSSVEEIGNTCDIVITSLANDAAAKEVYEALLTGSKERREKGDRGKIIFVDTSTLFPTLVGELEKKASEVEHRYFLSCPVFGPPPLAKDAKLILVLSGDASARRKIKDLLVPACARKVIDVGEDVEKGASLKLVGNSLILGVVEMLAESFTLADRTGVGAENIYEFIQEFLPTPSFLGYGAKMLKDDYPAGAGFSVAGGMKDAEHILALAAKHNNPMPVVNAAYHHLQTARQLTGSKANEFDWSFLVAGQRATAGVDPFKREVFKGAERVTTESAGESSKQ
ncbi:NAD(P)-binding protein [Atractiella rhizophila]|nr:NAD(P)-binding protein [Atractiella rhizophila]